jgi:hypothetical protein
MNEPTMKEIAEWLREAALIADYAAMIHSLKPTEGPLKKSVFHDRATQVEAMGERRCLTCEEWLGGIHPVFGCSYDGLVHCKKLNIPGQGANFCCIHWKRKEG